MSAFGVTSDVQSRMPVVISKAVHSLAIVTSVLLTGTKTGSV